MAKLVSAAVSRNFIWNFLGVGFYNLAQWLLILILARLADATTVGQFSLMLAIASPVYLTVGLNLRTVVATDARRRWLLQEYLHLRTILNAIALVVTVGVGIAIGRRGESLLALAVVGIAKGIEGSSQVYYGYFQLRSRLDLVSRSLLLRAAGGPVLFLAGFLATDKIAVAALGLVAGWALPQVLHDRRMAVSLSLAENRPLGGRETRRPGAVRELAKKAFPLGLDAGVSSLSTNIPRYAVRFVNSTASLGIYASQAYIAQIISMITSTMATVVVPRLAVYYHRGQKSAFIRLLVGLVLFGLAVVAIALFGTMLIGDKLIALTLGPAYVNSRLFVALVISAGFTTLQRTLCKSLEASHRFRNYLIVDGVTAGGIAVTAVPLVHAFGMVGAAYALSIGFAAGTLAVLVSVFPVIRDIPSPQPASVHPSGSVMESGGYQPRHAANHESSDTSY